MSFASPHSFWWLLTLPLLAALLTWANKKRKIALASFVGTILESRLLIGVSQSRRYLKNALFLFGILFLVVALAQPRWGFYWEEVQRRGIDIYVALDISKSMLARDTLPDRLERAKRKIQDFANILEGDRVGLIAFAGRSFVQCPLTLDYGALQTFLDSLNPNSVSVPGTAIGEAIEKATQSFETSQKSKALLLLTDGENLEGDIKKAVATAKTQGVRIYTIGIGTPEGAPIPETGGFKKDTNGEVVITRLDEATLKQISLDTGGSYVRTVPGDEDLQQIYKDMRKEIEERATKGGREKKLRERFQWPLLTSIFILLLEFLIPEGIAAARTSRRRFRLTLFSKRSSAALLFFLLLTSFPAFAEPALSERGRGQKAYQAGKYDEAIQHFLNAQIEDPNNSKLKYDLANSYYKAGKFDEAEKLFSSTTDSKDKEIQERSHYNLGNSQFRQGKYEDAIKQYEEALKLNPKDEDSRYNLDFVKKQMEQQKQQSQNSKDSKERSQRSKRAKG